MRAVLVVVLVGCIGSGSSDPDDPTRGDPDDPGHCFGGPVCDVGNVCVHEQGCLPADQVYAIRARWKVDGKLATTMACASAPSLTIRFTSDHQRTSFEFSPVPCTAGLYTLDRAPRFVNEVSLTPRGGDQSTLQYAPVDPVTGEAALDLTF